MGPEFYQTGYGKRFFEKQLPELITSISKIANVLEKQNNMECMVNKHIKSSVKLSWDEVGSIIAEVITLKLGRYVPCVARYEDYVYWTASAADGYTFSVKDLEEIFSFAKADESARSECIPYDSDTSKSVGMTVSERLLSIGLKTKWECFSICDEGLWLIGIEDTSVLLNYIKERGAEDVKS